MIYWHVLSFPSPVPFPAPSPPRPPVPLALARSRDNTAVNHDEANKPDLKPSKPMMSPCLVSGLGFRDKAKEEVCATRLKTLCQARPPYISATLHL